MEAKDFLKQIRKIDILIDNKQEEIDRLKKMYVFNVACGNNDSVQANIREYEKEITIAIDLLIDKKREVGKVIDQIENADMIDILYRRYFQYETWEQIAANKYFTFQWLHKLHAKALKEVQLILERVKE